MRNSTLIGLAFAGALACAAHAGATYAADAAKSAPKQAAAGKEIAQGKGTVNKIDAESGVVNLRHEAIPALRWPAMTMDFKVADKKLLNGLQPGQTVDFGLARGESGSYVVSRIGATK